MNKRKRGEGETWLNRGHHRYRHPKYENHTGDYLFGASSHLQLKLIGRGGRQRSHFSPGGSAIAKSGIGRAALEGGFITDFWGCHIKGGVSTVVKGVEEEDAGLMLIRECLVFFLSFVAFGCRTNSETSQTSIRAYNGYFQQDQKGV